MFTLKNDVVTAEFLETGRLVRLFDERAGRDLVKAGTVPRIAAVLFSHIVHLFTDIGVPAAKSILLI